MPVPALLTTPDNPWLQYVLQTVDQASRDGQPLSLVALRLGLLDIHRHPNGPQPLPALHSRLRQSLTPIAPPLQELVLIQWPPGDSSEVHDHPGRYGLQIVLAGCLQIASSSARPGNEPLNLHDCILQPGESLQFGGSEYRHRVSNPATEQAALSLHIYIDSERTGPDSRR